MKTKLLETAHILLVDDNPDNLSFLLEILDNRQYEIRIARDGRSALEIVKFEHMDLILLDIMMPGMNGFEVCAKLKSDNATREIPVIFMSALNETVNKVRGLELGAVDYITKPIQVEEVMARIKIHLKLRQLMQKEKEVSDLRSYFISMASHDLRSPLNIVSTSAYMLRRFSEEMSVDDMQKKLEMIELSAKRMIDILDNILTLNNVTSSRLSIQKEKLNYVKLCREVIEEFQLIFENSHVLELICAETDIQMNADPKIIWHILYNLISNAVKFSPKGRGISVKIFKENAEIVTQISDHGIGIPESDRQKIFEPHYRGGNVGDIKGEGMGLSIVRQLIALHYGRITTDSDIRKGTVFSVYLPAAE